ncbi:MAG: carboxypeptidase regulatory-like domain-containing protein, partial [Myxococcaceae bacterium]
EKLTRASLSLERGSALLGRTVVKGRSEPVPLAELLLMAEGTGPGDPWRRIDAPAEERVIAMSDTRGQFRIEGLAAGAWRVEARAVGYGRTVGKGVVVPRANELLLELAAAGTLEGFVLSSDGSAAAGATVSVAGGDEEVVVTTGQGGGFSAEVGQGSFTLSARRGNQTGSLPNPVTVTAGGSARGITIRLGEGCGIEGTVVAKASGAPVAGAAVDVSPHKKTGDSGRAVSDVAGAYEVTGLPPGSYDVVVTAAGYARLERRGVTVSAGQRFPLKLELGGTGAIEGTVKDEQGGPVAFASVRAGNRWGGQPGQSPEARTDEQGRFRLGELEAGRVTVQARREDASLGTTKVVDVVEGQTSQAELVLADNGFVTGTVTRKSGGPVGEPSRVRVSGRGHDRRGPSDSTMVPVEASGHYRVALPAGRWSLNASLDRPGGGFSPGVSVDVETGQTHQVDLVLNEEQAEAVTGVVLEPDGAPSPYALVALSVGSGGGQHQPRMMFAADEEGHFQFPSQPGTSGQPLSVRASNGGRSSEWAAVGANPRDLKVVLRPAAALFGKVLPGGGGPITSFTAKTAVVDPNNTRFYFRGGNEALEFTGDRFELHDVAPERLKVDIGTGDGRTGTAEVSLSPGERGEVTVTLQQGATVRGVVVSSETGKPVSGSYVTVDGKHADAAGVGADGKFSFGVLAAGEHTVVAVAPLHGRASSKVTLAVGEVRDVGELVLTKQKSRPGSIGAMFEMNGGLVRIAWVTPESPAERAGLRQGDVVLAIDGTPVKSTTDAATRAQGAPGSTASFTIRRGTQEKTVQVTRAS